MNGYHHDWAGRSEWLRNYAPSSGGHDSSQVVQAALCLPGGLGVERGQRMPSILVVQQLATALGTTLSELLAEVEREQD